MADDIDIEEHDILEHPRFRDFLPDPDIKEEPEEVDGDEYEDPEEQNYEDYDYYEAPDYDPELEERSYQDYGEMSSESYAVPVSPPQLTNDYQQNKIILGTKPCSNTSQHETGNTKSPISPNASNNVLATRLCPKSRRPLAATDQIISNIETLKASKSELIRPSTSQGTFVFGKKPGPKCGRPIPSTSRTILNSNGSITIGTKPNPKSDVTEAATSQIPIVFGSKPCPKPNVEVHLSTQSKACPKSRKPDLKSGRDAPILTSILNAPQRSIFPERVPENAIVVLEDWGARLEASLCYCDQCQTLFATQNALDAHNMIAHSFLVALEDPPTPEMQSPEGPVNPEQKYCNQCQTYFADDNLLIQHLYDHLTAKKGKMYYKCLVCFSFFITERRYYNHSHMYHGVNVGGPVKKFLYTGVCQICNRAFTSLISHNKHMRHVHRDLLLKKVKNQLIAPNKIVKKSVAPTVLSKIVKKTVKARAPSKRDYSGKMIAEYEETESVDSETAQSGGKFKCGKCETVYLDKATLRAHICSKHRAETFIEITQIRSENIHGSRVHATSKPKVGNLKCVKCKTFYPTTTALKTHISQKHPKERAYHIDVKKSAAQDKGSQDEYNDSEADQDDVPLTSQLNIGNFKCVKCKLFYATKNALRSHISRKHPDEKAFIDLRKGTAEDRNSVMRLQNYGQISNADSKTILLTSKRAIARFKCVKCKILYSNKNSLKRHIYKKHPNEKVFTKVEQNQSILALGVKKLKCLRCKTLYSTRKTILTHIRHHHPNDKKFVEVTIKVANPMAPVSEYEEETPVNAKPSLKRKQAPTHLHVPKKAKTSIKVSVKYENARVGGKLPIESNNGTVPFYYCEYCHTFSKTTTNRSFHSSKECLSIPVNKTVCRYCGLLFRGGNPFKCHMLQHEKDKVKFADFEFHSIKNLKPIVPALPSFRTCGSCRTHHMDAKHTCKDAYKICNICGEQYDPLAYKLHQVHHKYLTSTKTDEVSELIQKYESLKSTWNIIYMCPECDLATDSYDRAVDHAQRHLTSSANQRTAQMCDICSINFDEQSIVKHKKLHTNKDISRASFSILTYRYKDLLTDDWFKLFKNLSQAEIDQITSPSVYVTRRVKMSLILNGPPEFTIYKCESCKNYVDSTSVFDHSLVCSGDVTPHPCSICDIPFVSSTALKKHQQIHKTSEVTTNSYRIVSFNATADKQFNRKLANTESLPLYDLQSDEDYIAKNAKVAVFLQCLKCKSASSSADYFRSHICKKNSDKYLWSCRKCAYVSLHRNRDSHLSWHEDNINLNRRDILMIPFDRTEDGAATDAPNKVPPNKLYLWFQCCKCKALLSSSDAKHDCTSDLETCSLCGYQFTPISYKYHIKLHEKVPNLTSDKIHVVPLKSPAKTKTDNMKVNKIDFEDDDVERIATVYKCRCGLHFTSEKTVQKHYEVCSPDVDIASENCSKCGLLFPTELLVSHLCNQHRRGIKGKCRVVTPPINLYRCSDCLCVFTKMTEFSDHHTSKACDTSLAVNCDKCDMTFHQRGIDEHRETHEEFVKLRHKIFTMGRYSRVTLYKCNVCQVNCLDEDDFTDHLSTCKNTTNRSQCKSCALVFASKSINRHVKMHHSSLVLTADDFEIVCKDPCEVTKTEIELVSKTKLLNTSYGNIDFSVKLFKCWCDLCLSTWSRFVKHLDTDHGAKKQWCPECGFMFLPEDLKEHIEVHHKIMNLETEDFIVVTKCDGKYVLKRKRSGVNSEPKQSNCFYECDICCLSFPNLGNAVSHVKYCRDENRFDGEICNSCGLKFAEDKLLKHKAMYHDALEYSIEDLHVYIVTKHSECKKSNVKKDHAVTITENTDLDTSDLDNSSVSNVEYEPLTKTKVSLYKCIGCKLHFLRSMSALKHASCGLQEKQACEHCGLSFTIYSCQKHKKIHHSKGNNYTIDDFKIHIVLDRFTHESKTNENDIYKCTECNINFLCHRSLGVHYYDRNHAVNVVSPCPYCGLRFTSRSLFKHKVLHHQKTYMRLEDFVVRNIHNQIIDGNDHTTNQEMLASVAVANDIPTPDLTEAANSCDNLNDTSIRSNISDTNVAELDTAQTSSYGDDVSVETLSQIDEDTTDVLETPSHTAVSESSDSSKDKKLKKDKNEIIRLYKCGECNVFFLNQNTCYKHIMYHTPLDTKEYIECKLCSLQFKIMTLAQHIRRHHNTEFDFSKVLVEEYEPNKEGQKTQKIDIYYAIDKVQSRLVSTTTDDDKSTQEVTQSNVEEPAEAVTSEPDGQLEKDEKTVREDGNNSLLNEKTNDRLSEIITPPTSDLLDKEGILSNILKKDTAPSLNTEHLVDPTNLTLENTSFVPDLLDKDISLNIELEKNSIFTTKHEDSVEVDIPIVVETDKDNKSECIKPEKDNNISTSSHEDSVGVDKQAVEKDNTSDSMKPEKDKNISTLNQEDSVELDRPTVVETDKDSQSDSMDTGKNNNKFTSNHEESVEADKLTVVETDRVSKPDSIELEKYNNISSHEQPIVGDLVTVSENIDNKSNTEKDRTVIETDKDSKANSIESEMDSKSTLSIENVSNNIEKYSNTSISNQDTIDNVVANSETLDKDNLSNIEFERDRDEANPNKDSVEVCTVHSVQSSNDELDTQTDV